MSDKSKTSKRLGIVGAAAVVGLVPISVLGASPAFAVTSPSLTLSSTNVGATGVTATNGFTTNSSTGAIAADGTITIDSLSASGSTATSAAVQLPTATSNYSISFTPVGGTATNDPVYTTNTTLTATSATLGVTNSIPAGAAVTVTITGADNPTSASTVYFSDATSAEPTAVNTNTVSISSPVVGVPTVTQVNPTAYTDLGSEPFTVTGSGFVANTSPASPVVCFVLAGTTVPAASTPCATPTDVSGTTTVAYAPALTITNSSATEIQGTSPLLTAGKQYNVVVYNYDASASPATYTAASTTSGQTLVGVAKSLNFVPESGVRVVNSTIGAGLPKGALTPKTVYSIPASTFATSLANPTNLPSTLTGLSLNVTAVGPTGAGNLQVWSSGSSACGTAPASSTVNFQPPQDTNNTTIVGLTSTSTGAVCVQDNGASVPVIMDVTGYTTAGFTATSTRPLDTRYGTGGLLGPLSSGTIYRFNAVAAGLTKGEPVALNVTAVAPSSVGNLRVFPETTSTPTLSDVPNTSVITYIPNTDASSMFVTQVGSDGYIDLYSAGTGSVNVVFDEIGSLTGPSGTKSSLTPVATPFRIYDSRPGGIADGATVTVTASPSGAGSNFVPVGALGIVGDIGDINPAAQGNLRTFPAGGSVPATSTINNFPMQTRSTSAVEALNPTDGAFSIESSGSSTNATFDVTGYIAG